MKLFIKILTISALFISGTFYLSCLEDNPVSKGLSDAQKVKALQKVTLSYDSVTFNLTLPGGYENINRFADLSGADSARFYNLENYQISIGIYLTADNTDKDAEDAKFDGITINTVFKDYVDWPVAVLADPFEVDKGKKQAVPAEGELNLNTHKLPGKYIFKKLSEGSPVTTTMSPLLHYKIGELEGDIPIPDIKKDIPTRASDETKKFLTELIASGILD